MSLVPFTAPSPTPGFRQIEALVLDSVRSPNSKRAYPRGALTEYIALREPSNLPFADHVHCFVPIDGIQCAVNRTKPETRYDALLNEAVILLNHVV